jgi:hypothetical protein
MTPERSQATEEKKEVEAVWARNSCQAPVNIEYFVFCNCLTINNGACREC